MATERYPLEIESIGEDVCILISRGHHDIHEFMRAVRRDYDWPLGVPKHIWMHTRPARPGSGYRCMYDVVPQGTRGAWPATHVQEAWGADSYEAKHPAGVAEPGQLVGYRVEWKPGDPCYLSAADYARESHRDGADTWGLFTEPQPGCDAEVEVYHGWCWVRPRYAVGALSNLTGFTPLYLGPLIHRGQLSEAAAHLFPSLIEDRLREARPDLYADSRGVGDKHGD